MDTSISSDIKIAHITDIHLPRDRQSIVHDVHTYDALERTLAKIAESDPDLVLVTGDIANDGGEEPYKTLSQLLEPFSDAIIFSIKRSRYL